MEKILNSLQNMKMISNVYLLGWLLLRETISSCPAVLLEIGFMTNTDEADYFLKPKNIKAQAMTILMGIINFYTLLNERTIQRSK
jgi:N-acetylmuramoyl-L-alanine amidase